MNLTQTSARSTVLAQTLFVALVGLTLVFAAGFAQSHALHDAAHDMRHSTGFVSYTHLTLPTILRVVLSVGAVRVNNRHNCP